MVRFLPRSLCLRPSYSLRRQLLFSFGSAAFVTLAVVATVAFVCGNLSGNLVADRADDLLREQAVVRFVRNSVYVADTLLAYKRSVDGMVQLAADFVEDRIVGYPDAGWENDTYVPFFDRETQRNRYPLNSKPLPMDWDIDANIDVGNGREHLQDERISPQDLALFTKFTLPISSSPSYFMQGVCNPEESRNFSFTYYKNCTSENNDPVTGGVVQPTSTSEALYEKAADIAAILKPIYEVQGDIRLSGVYFHNSGAGSMVHYPGHILSALNRPYESVGCEWMRKTNPHTDRPFGTDEEIARCRPAGTIVPPREYNPMERSWCRDIALQAQGVSWGTPFNNTFGGLTLIPVGKAIFDRRTKNFIGVVSFMVLLDSLKGILLQSKLHEDSELVVVLSSDSTVYLSTLDDQSTLVPEITETGIITEENYRNLTNTSNFIGKKWGSREEIMESLTQNVLMADDSFYTVYPIPLPPNEPDPDYNPDFFIIHVISNTITVPVTKKIDSEIDKEVRRIAVSSFTLAACGMLVTFTIVWYVSGGLTRPLLWMERVAWGIVNHADQRADGSFKSAVFDEPKEKGNCLPSTEISELVHEFQSMVTGFSGKGASLVAHPDILEIPNQLTWQSDYQQLYSGSGVERRNSLCLAPPVTAEDQQDGIQSLETSTPDLTDERKESEDAVVEAAENGGGPGKPFMTQIIPARPKKNPGANILCGTPSGYLFRESLHNRFSGRRSSLFWWLILLVVAPLVLTNVCISTIVSTKIAKTVNRWVYDLAQAESLKLEIQALKSTASLKATQAQMSVDTIIGDLHIVNRFAGWLFFGGLKRSSSFTHMEETTQECRVYPADTSCPLFADESRTPCACEWKDVHLEVCTDINYTDPRTLQNLFFYGQARDYDMKTGRRENATSFGPGVDDSSNATSWWHDIDTVPGHGAGSNASGYATTYDRLRVSSAMSVVSIPIYNYLAANLGYGYKKHYISAFVAFDSDGMMTGYSGCSYKHTFSSHFESNEINRAYEIAPNLCPRGKFGYDARCRDWYSTGKELYEEVGRPVHVTAPYVFAHDKRFAASATSPVVNPETGEYVGQTLLDFSSHALDEMFDGLAESLAFVITPEADVTGSDTVVFYDGNISVREPSAISDLLFRYENAASPDRKKFENGILERMKSGKTSHGEFSRAKEDNTTERMTIAYAPVNVTVRLPLDPSQFFRGTNATTIHVYSVGIAYSDDDIRQRWKLVEDAINDDLSRLRAIYLAIVVSVSLLFIAYTCYITVQVTTPLITLLRIVQTINVNSGVIEDDLPPLQGGSREMHRVYNAFAKLFKIITISNSLCFSGNLLWAHSLMTDALKLFRKVNDIKAIGVGCNNLANTLHAMCSNARYVEECCTLLPGTCVVLETQRHYNEAIAIAQDEFDGAESDEEKADYAQQLADRLFNRGLFLLLVASDKCAPSDARKTGLSDIARVRHLDADVKDFWLERQLLLRHSDVYFYRLIRRTVGLFGFYRDEELRAIWDLSELVEDADRFLFCAWDQPTAPLFDRLTRVGRLQQLETMAMLVDMSKGRNVEAASLALRMFVEDDYILESAFKVASTVLLKIIRDEDEWSNVWNEKTKASVKADLRKMLRTCKQTNLDVGKCLVVALEISKQWEGDSLLEKVNENLLKLYDDCCLVDDHMGLVACDMNVPLSVKADNEGLQRTSLDLASSSTSEWYSPSFPTAMQMLVDSVAPTQVDSFILLLADGVSWDGTVQASLKAQIERTNRENVAKIHVFILGMGLDSAVRDHCRSMCTASKKSLYIDIDLSNVDKSFEEVSGVIRGCIVREPCADGLMMEKF